MIALSVQVPDDIVLKLVKQATSEPMQASVKNMQAESNYRISVSLVPIWDVDV